MSVGQIETFGPDAGAGKPSRGAFDVLASITLWAERIFLPLVLYGIGQIFYWLWFGYSYRASLCLQLLGSVPLLLAFTVIAFWFIGICLLSDPEKASADEQ